MLPDWLTTLLLLFMRSNSAAASLRTDGIPLLCGELCTPPAVFLFSRLLKKFARTPSFVVAPADAGPLIAST